MGSGSGHGYPGSAVRRVTVPCRATHTAIESATTSGLPDMPARTQSSIPRTSSANASAPNSSTGRPSGPSWTGAQYSSGGRRWPENRTPYRAGWASP